MRLTQVSGKEANDQHSCKERMILQPNFLPVVARELRLARQGCRAHVAEIARDSKYLVADQQQHRHKQRKEGTRDVPRPRN